MIVPKRYLTWFFLGEWPGGDVAIDDHEVVQHVGSHRRRRWPRGCRWHRRRSSRSPSWSPSTRRRPASCAAASEPPAVETVAGRTADGTPVVMWTGDAG